MPRKGRPQRVTGTFPEALKQGRTAMPYQKRRAAAFGNGQSPPESAAIMVRVSMG
nr:MAG TPA: hypothetical protein [Caudoviricetes sp.]